MISVERQNKILIKIAAQFRSLRRTAGLKQKTVIEDTGLNIGHIEAAKKNINLTSLKILCNYYNISLTKFFKDIDL